MKVKCKLREDSAVIGIWPANIDTDEEGLIEAEIETACIADEYGEPLFDYRDGQICPRAEGQQSKDAKEEAALLALLSSTDWLVLREMETGKKPDDKIRSERQAARDRISELRVKRANLPT
jgi:hypothetical protein